MRAVVVYESMFGNTRLIAEAIGRGLGPPDDVVVVPVGRAGPELVAAVAIGVSAVSRLLDPRPLTQVGVGLAVSVVAAAVNGAVAGVLLRAGRRHRSISLTTDGRHLLTDVWTSGGVVVGVASVALTGWERLDPLIALAVGVNIVVQGVRLVGQSVGGLMDAALPAADHDAVERVLGGYRRADGIRFHALRTRQAGVRRFVSVHVLVPG